MELDGESSSLAAGGDTRMTDALAPTATKAVHQGAQGAHLDAADPAAEKQDASHMRLTYMCNPTFSL
jgi:hypothetical protein